MHGERIYPKDTHHALHPFRCLGGPKGNLGWGGEGLAGDEGCDGGVDEMEVRGGVFDDEAAIGVVVLWLDLDDVGEGAGARREEVGGGGDPVLGGGGRGRGVPGVEVAGPGEEGAREAVEGHWGWGEGGGEINEEESMSLPRITRCASQIPVHVTSCRNPARCFRPLESPLRILELEFRFSSVAMDLSWTQNARCSFQGVDGSDRLFSFRADKLPVDRPRAASGF